MKPAVRSKLGVLSHTLQPIGQYKGPWGRFFVKYDNIVTFKPLLLARRQAVVPGAGCHLWPFLPGALGWRPSSCSARLLHRGAAAQNKRSEEAGLCALSSSSYPVPPPILTVCFRTYCHLSQLPHLPPEGTATHPVMGFLLASWVALRGFDQQTGC